MLTDEQTTDLQFAIDDGDLETIAGLLENLTGAELTELQLYSNSTVLMYALERSTPQVVRLLLDRGAGFHELPWSDNNELKSALRHRDQAPDMVKLALTALPTDLALEMITSDWDPEDTAEGQAISAMEMAEKLSDPTCLELLRGALKAQSSV